MMIKKVMDHPMFHGGFKLSKFLVAGLPAILIAIPLNYFLVTHLNWEKSIAYGLVIIGQITLNFFMCRWFVFENRSDRSVFNQFKYFFSGILFFRCLDWGLYTVLVTFFGFYYLAIQLLNVALFAYLKYKFSQRVIELN